MIVLLMQAGVGVCFRKHQKRHTDFRRGRRLGKNDHIVAWHRPRRPPWMSKEVYDSMPKSIELREIRYVITKPGRKQDPFVIATTITDVDGDDSVQHEDLAELFGFRWNVELDIRSIKTHMNLNHLRCKSPAMVHKEFWVTMLAYNAIRTAALSSAWLRGTRPREVSFVSCCQFVLASWDVIDIRTGMAHRAYCVSRMAQIGKCLVG